MSTHTILDSSPVALPPVRPRPLKRSASTASLPTPPRTLHKKKSRSRSRHSSQDTDSESNYSQSDSDEEHQEDRVVSGRKKRRTSMTLRSNDEEEDENEFWTGRRKEARDSDDDASPALLQYRVKALVSPPPSLRQTTSAPEPPVTPESAGSSSSRTTRLTRAARRQALRDSPENPFLDDSPPSAAGSPAPRTPTQHEEKPLVTYVFRGMKAQFANPMYNLPPSAHEHSLLPVEHPDFEANEACPPKLLFPSAHRRQVRRHSPDASLPPTNLTDEEIERTDSLRAGAVVRGRANPVRRAQGPVRPARR